MERAKEIRSNVLYLRHFWILLKKTLVHYQSREDSAVYKLLSDLLGSSAASLLQLEDKNAFLRLIHKGRGRGLAVWADDKNEGIFYSRSESVREELSNLLSKGKFRG